MSEVTRILQAAQSGEADENVAEKLLPHVYEELRRLASHRMARQGSGETLQATALVHEAYLRLIGDVEVPWDGRGHFFAAAAEAMRRILIERARRKARQRHGGELRRTTLQADVASLDDADESLLDLDRALTELEARDAQMAGVVKLRYFAGLSIEETAAALNSSSRSVNRSWVAARAWLRSRLATDAAPDD